MEPEPVCLSRAEEPAHLGIICSQTYTDGELLKSLYVPGGGSRHPEPHYPETKDKIVMEGNKIFKLAVTVMTQAIEENLRTTGYQKEDIDWLIPHQANVRIMDAIAHNLHFPPRKSHQQHSVLRKQLFRYHSPGLALCHSRWKNKAGP